jgi:predicted SAM-dependent methyltransferase
MKINLGSGYRKDIDCINVDNREVVSPDVVADINEGLPFKTGSINEVRAIDFLEHIPLGKTISAIEEIYRVLENGGILYHMTPSTSGAGAFMDPTHLSFWNINSWIYYMDDAYRNLYSIKAKFVGRNHDIVTSEQLKVIHTRGILKAVK